MNGKKEKYLVAAQKFIERGQIDKALGEFAKVVEEDPKDTRTWLKMAELHAKLGQSADATEIYLRTGELYTEQGFAQKAVAVYKNVLKLSPGTVAAHLKLGRLYQQLGLVSDAVQQLELGAAALQRAGNGGEAVAALRQALEMQPENVVLRVKLAEAASLGGLVDEAVREFGRAADQLKAQGRVEESLRVAERLLFHQPENHAKARELAEAYIAKGSPRQALPKLQACLNAAPGDPRTLSLLARALEQLGQAEKAVSVLKELIRLTGELGRGSERDAAILRALTLAPGDPELQALALGHQLRGGGAGGATGVGAEATPPPVIVAADAGAGGGSFDLSGVVRIVAGGGGTGSGRVALPIGVGETSARVISSATGASGGADVDRILAESEVFVKYGLLERAVDHLGRVFELEPENRPARDRLIGVLQKLGRRADAAHHLDILARQLGRTQPAEARKLAEKAALLDPNGPAGGRARAFIEGRAAAPLEPQPRMVLDIDVDEGDEPSGRARTPPLELDAGATPPPVSVAREDGTDDVEFEAIVETGDVVAISEAASSPASLVDVAWDEEGADQVTPPPVDLGGPRAADRTPRVVALNRKAGAGAGGGAHGDEEDDDPAGAFDDAAATIASGAYLVEGLAAGGAAAKAEPSRGSPVSVGASLADADEDDLSAELEQVAFFVDQSLPEEARALLADLEERFPGHPRIAATLRDVEAFEARLGAFGSTVIEAGPGSIAATPAPRAVFEGGGRVDLATHADLAIAYKEMGLYDAAIGELKLLTQDPDREVFALTTMGECYEAKGSFTEAVIRYKRALNCTPIAPEEITDLYFLLGGAFERLGDISEALFFFEKVARRDPKFRDVDQRIGVLKPRLVKKAR